MKRRDFLRGSVATAVAAACPVALLSKAPEPLPNALVINAACPEVALFQPSSGTERLTSYIGDGSAQSGYMGSIIDLGTIKNLPPGPQKRATNLGVLTTVST